MMRLDMAPFVDGNYVRGVNNMKIPHPLAPSVPSALQWFQVRGRVQVRSGMLFQQFNC